MWWSTEEACSDNNWRRRSVAAWVVVAIGLLMAAGAYATDPTYDVTISARNASWGTTNVTDVWGISETIRYHAECNPCEGTHNCLFATDAYWEEYPLPSCLYHVATDSTATDRAQGSSEDPMGTSGDTELYADCIGEGFDHGSDMEWFAVVDVNHFTVDTDAAIQGSDGKWYTDKSATGHVTVTAEIAPEGWDYVGGMRTSFMSWWKNDVSVSPEAGQLTYLLSRSTCGEYVIKCKAGAYGTEKSVTIVVLDALDLREVTFSGTKYHVVSLDDSPTVYSGPHWNDASSPADGDADDMGDSKYPVCWATDTDAWMYVSAKIEAGSATTFPTFKLTAQGTGSYNFTDNGTFTAASGGNPATLAFSSGAVKCSKEFTHNRVDYLNPLVLTWKVSFDGGTTWLVLGQSQNEVFVTRGDPACATRFRSLLYLACKTTGGDSDSTCLTNTWSSFSSGSGPANVHAWNDTSKAYDRALYYYNGYTNKTSAAAMLADTNGNGQCGAWADLMCECLKANNVSNVVLVLIEDPTTSSIDGFVVKNLTFGTPSYPADAPWQYTGSDITFTTSGLAGQNMTTPSEKDFDLHYMVRSTGAYTYYDPSYGKTVSGADLNTARGNWRDAALDAWRRIYLNRYSKISDLPTDLPVFTDL